MAERCAEVEDGSLPLSSQYTPIESCTTGPGVSLSAGPAPLYPGCLCTAVCQQDSDTTACSCTHAYNSRGRLKDEYFSLNSRPIFECNSACACAPTCPNRASQRPPPSPLHVFPAQSKGYGVRSSHVIPKGSYVIEYVGEVVQKSEAEKRLHGLTVADSCYIVTYKEHCSSGVVLTTSVDASRFGNVARFINHSCSPNLAMLPVRTDSLLPKLCLFACRNVPASEELCFSYCGSRVVQEKIEGDVQELQPSLKLGRKVCLCNSKNCIKFLPLEIT